MRQRVTPSERLPIVLPMLTQSRSEALAFNVNLDIQKGRFSYATQSSGEGYCAAVPLSFGNRRASPRRVSTGAEPTGAESGVRARPTQAHDVGGTQS